MTGVDIALEAAQGRCRTTATSNPDTSVAHGQSRTWKLAPSSLSLTDAGIAFTSGVDAFGTPPPQYHCVANVFANLRTRLFPVSTT